MSKVLLILIVIWVISLVGVFAFISTSPIISQTITVKAVYPSNNILTVVTTDGLSYGVNYSIGAFIEVGHTYYVETNDYRGTTTLPIIEKVDGDVTP